jgi:hypothetical protein
VLEPRPTTSGTLTETHPSPLVWSDDDRPSYLAASTDSMAISDWSADTWEVWIVCREGLAVATGHRCPDPVDRARAHGSVAAPGEHVSAGHNRGENMTLALDGTEIG